MKAGDVCNREVVVVQRETSVAEAARLMRELHVGDLVVVDKQQGRRVPVGILTDRDLVLEVLAEGVDVNTVTVGDIMSYELATANEHDDLYETIKHMRARGVRRIPVVGPDKSLVGILTVDDLIELYAEEFADLARLITREQTREKERRK